MGKDKEEVRGRSPGQLPEGVVLPAVPVVSSVAGPVMSWPQAAAVIATVAIGFTFEFLMIVVAGMDYRVVTGITVVLVAAIVSVLIPQGGRGGWRRAGNVVRALLGADGSGGAR
jgi:hypothetical protein